MSKTLTTSLLAVFGLALAAPAAAQETAQKAAWDITEPRGPVTEIEFETDEGTWMSVDVSPDGRTLVFDLLGDLYTMPIEGGEATLLLGGHAYETQPRWSPDGSMISFTSDRDGLENIWVVDADGSNPRQITRERERQVKDAVWSPDGEYLIARKHFRNTRSLGAGEMWMWHIGGGSGLQLTERRNWEQNAAEPEISPDGRFLYWSEDMTPGGGFQYNRDPHAGIYAIRRLDRETGQVSTFIGGPGGAVRPRLSPDGNTLAYVKRVGLKSVLMLHDVESGRERALFDGLDQDQQEAWAIFGVYPSFAWTPGGEAIVIWAQGKLWRIDAASGEAAQIPFRARVRQQITEAVRFTQDVAPENFDVRLLRWVSVSPDGGSVVYNALGRLWIRDLPNGEPRRLTRDEERFELYPSWSPDGRSIVFATWNDDELGAVWTIRTNGRDRRQLTTRPGHYVEPAFSPDGEQVVFRRIGGDNLRGRLYSRETGVYRVAARGGEPVLVTERGSRPLFDRTGQRIFVVDFQRGERALASVDLHGGDRRVHVTSSNATDLVPSPDGRYVAIHERHHVHVAPMPMTGKPVSIGPNTREYPIARVSRDAGFNLHWSADGRRLYWSLGPELYWRDLAETFAFFDGADTESIKAAPESEGLHIGFQAATDRPEGTVALVGARVVTMRGDEVLENATVVVDGNRIAAVGATGQVTVPSNARVVDVSGKTIMPGIIDVHAHIGTGSSGILPQAPWNFLANLAFGVTTMHDPSNDTEAIFAASELIRAGEVVGPRLFSTGRILYGAEGSFKALVDEYDDAVSHLRRLQKVGGFTVKSYNQPRRDVRQKFVEAARELNMMVVPEGGSTYFFNMTHVLDGHTGLEHNIPVAPLYNDALTVIAASETGYTPTLVVNYGGLNAEYYWYQESNVWENARLQRFMPPGVLEARSRRPEKAASDDYQHVEVARAAKSLLDRGTRVLIGAHGQRDGLAAHWEMWSLAQGGFTPLEVIRAATLHGAEYLGLDQDLGSIEPGKLADLVVLDANPLENIRNTESVRYVMINGRLFDAWTMDQVAPVAEGRGAFWWER